ncbi:hypothetical protein FRC0481_00708 [Corynebacterium diphtheriae]|nr:hypothetical protein FRC0481_00708 [Corynebacterium diphtheriae]CAB0957721.1 hypothetical protein FRC0480_00718 [Corynebacterium diphtheriae]
MNCLTILSNPRQKTLHVGVDDFLSGGINLRLLFYSGEGWWTLIESIPKKNMFEAKRLNDQAVLDQKAAEECAADERVSDCLCAGGGLGLQVVRESVGVSHG